MKASEKLEAMARVVPKLISPDKIVRIRRGVLHSTVCEILRIPRSNENIRIIKVVLKAMGVRPVTIQGRSHYSTAPSRTAS